MMSVATEQINQRAHISSKKPVALSALSDGVMSASVSENLRRSSPPQYSSQSEYLDSKTDHETANKSGTSLIWKSLLCLICGIVFGVSMHKAHMSYPEVVRRQMLLKQFTFLKFLLSALATSMFTLSLLAMNPITHRSFMITCNGYYNKLMDKSVMSSVVGGLVMGAGMTVAGSCPVTVFPQIGSLVPNVGYLFLGGLTGVLIYSVLKPAFDSLLRPTIKESSNPWSNSPYFVLALPLVAMFGITVCAFETLLPWDSEIRVGLTKFLPIAKRDDDGLLAMSAWPPYVGGMLVGVLQLPLVLAMHETLGGSSSLIVMVSQVLVGPLKKLSPFACKYQWGFRYWWQIFYVAGAIFGGYLSAVASGTLGEAPGVPPVDAFLGGMLMNLGARIGGGCTSGHGLSGMGLLSIMSFIMMASTFLGGISVAFAMRLLGAM